MTSGAFTAAYLELAPVFERTTRNKIATTFGGSAGDGPETIRIDCSEGSPRMS